MNMIVGQRPGAETKPKKPILFKKVHLLQAQGPWLKIIFKSLLQLLGLALPGSGLPPQILATAN